MRKSTATHGSQRLLQIAVNHRPDLLNTSLAQAGAVNSGEEIEWLSPIASDGHREYRDCKALTKLRISTKLSTPLSDFWPKRGPVWDALAVTPSGAPILVEAKAHIAEAVSPRSMANAESLAKIRRSLDAARAVLAPRSQCDWSGQFYQYANRLAFQLFLTRENRIPSRLVFLYFTNAVDMAGPRSELEWQGATRLLHVVLGLPADLSRFGVHHAFLDAHALVDS